MPCDATSQPTPTEWLSPQTPGHSVCLRFPPTRWPHFGAGPGPSLASTAQQHTAVAAAAVRATQARRRGGSLDANGSPAEPQPCGMCGGGCGGGGGKVKSIMERPTEGGELEVGSGVVGLRPAQPNPDFGWTTAGRNPTKNIFLVGTAAGRG